MVVKLNFEKMRDKGPFPRYGHICSFKMIDFCMVSNNFLFVFLFVFVAIVCCCCTYVFVNHEEKFFGRISNLQTRNSQSLLLRALLWLVYKTLADVTSK